MKLGNKGLRLTWGAGGLSEYRDVVTAVVLALVIFSWLYYSVVSWAESGAAPKTGIPERVVEARTVEAGEPFYQLRERLVLRRGVSGVLESPSVSVSVSESPSVSVSEPKPRRLRRVKEEAPPPEALPEEPLAFRPVAFDSSAAEPSLPAPRRCRLRLDAVTGLPAVADCDGGRVIGGRAQVAPLPGRLALEFTVDGARYMASFQGQPGLPAKCKTVRNLDYFQMALNIAGGAAGGALGAAVSEAGLGPAGGAAAGALASVAGEAADVLRDLRERPNEERRVCIAARGTTFELERVP